MKTLVRLLLKEQSDQGLHCLSVQSVLILSFYGIEHFKNMHNIPSEKYFDMVSEG